MLRLRLIHWKAAEAVSYINALEEAGHRVEYTPEFSPSEMRAWRTSPPDVFVIDLSRLPSHGREIAIALRQTKATRMVPLVFCNGEEEKVAKTRALLPDAIYCPLSRLKSALQKLPSKAVVPVVPLAMMDRYAARSAAQKLGVKIGAKVCLLDAPRDGVAALGDLPASVTFVESPKDAAVTLLFATDPLDLQRQLSEWRFAASQTKLWVAWKKGKATQNGIGETLIRETGIALGLVDYKVCSINQVWSGLLFAAKREKS